MFDLLIKNGKVIDGAGSKMMTADIGISEDTIMKIGNLKNEKADKIIEATDKYVAPGFIDINNHSDTYWRLFQNPHLESLLYQGITTIVGGNCGASLAPLTRGSVINSIQKWTDVRNLNVNWLSMEEFLAEIENRELSVNFSSLVGHSTIRRGLIESEVRKLTKSEFSQMEQMLENALQEGAMGLSTGLVYTHAKLANTEELIKLSKIVKKHNGIYATHIRDEAGRLVEAIDEAIEIGEKAGVSVEISHLKVMGQENWPLIDQAISKIEKAKEKGIEINFDVYPYTYTGSVLYIMLPDWVAKGGKKLMAERLKDPQTRQLVISEMQESKVDYSKVIVSIGSSSFNRTQTRKDVSEIAKIQDKSAEEVIIDLLIVNNGRIITMMDVLSEENILAAIKNPLSMIVSNGSGYDTEHRETGELVHPRNFGAFPKFLSEYVKEKKLLSWEEGIHKITGKPAAKYNLKKRGLLKKGNLADIVVFDPKKIEDKATIENPYQYSKGVDSLVVNGKVVIEYGKYNKTRAGKVIKRS